MWRGELFTDFLPQTLLPAALVPGSREQAGHCAQALRSVATAPGRPFSGAQTAGQGRTREELGPGTPRLPSPCPPHPNATASRGVGAFAKCLHPAKNTH